MSESTLETQSTAQRRLSLAELLQRSLEDDAVVGHDDESERERWDDDEGSSGG
jgi:hypothetical protein